jgi:hypothetical protein
VADFVDQAGGNAAVGFNRQRRSGGVGQIMAFYHWVTAGRLVDKRLDARTPANAGFDHPPQFAAA